MTLSCSSLVRLVALGGLAFVAGLAVFLLLGRAAPTPVAEQVSGAVLARHRTTDDEIRSIQAAAQRAPRRAALWAGLADAYLQKVRETGDASYYPRADGALHQALALDPGNVDALTGMGSLANARHDFREGLRWGVAARRAGPFVVRPLGVLADSYVELGRYTAARQTLQEMVNAHPDLASYARVSYLRELHGDLLGALRAMTLAADAGGDAPENVAYVETLQGNLDFDLGRLAPARRAYLQAIERFPRYVPASAGLARLDAVEGHTAAAIGRYRDAVNRLPLPEYVVGLGETELAAGRIAEGRRDLEIVRAEERLLQANGVNTDVDVALFEANHGSPARGVALGRRAWAEAPSVRSADALGWALTRAGQPGSGLSWAQRALRLGSRDATFLFHAGIAAAGAGQRASARAYLTRGLSLQRHFSVLYAPVAHRALARLG